jgi:hypothetical protein
MAQSSPAIIKTSTEQTRGTIYTTSTGLQFVCGGSHPSDSGDFYTMLHLGGGNTHALISEAWSGTEPVLATVDGTRVRPKTPSDATDCGYLIPDVNRTEPYAEGDMVGIYFRGIR